MKCSEDSKSESGFCLLRRKGECCDDLSTLCVLCQLRAVCIRPQYIEFGHTHPPGPHSRGVDQIKAKTLLQKIYILLGELKEHIREKECLLYVCIDSDACISDAWDLLVMNGQTCVIKY